jgi:hypothetical protein
LIRHALDFQPCDDDAGTAGIVRAVIQFFRLGMLNYFRDKYCVIKLVGPGSDIAKVWGTNFPPGFAIELDDDSWEVIIVRDSIPLLERVLRRGRLEFSLILNYSPCGPREEDVRQHGVRVAQFLACRRFQQRTEANLCPFLSCFYKYYINKHRIIL